MYSKLKTIAGTLVLTLPAAGYAEPVVPASQPLFLMDAVKHNIMLGVDDSTSMDFEVLFPTNDGVLWLDGNGSFANLDGTFVGGPSLPKYTYLFPNGRSTDYANGAGIANSGHYAIPPIRAYAFARSAVFNKAYYDPSESYGPWPSFGSINYPEYAGTQAPFDPNEYDASNGSTYMNLVALRDTSQDGDRWDFDIQNSGMVCDDSGATDCAEGSTDYTYWPATYWVAEETATVQFNPGLVNGESFNEGNSTLLEAESANLSLITDGYKRASENSEVSRGVLVKSAAGLDYIATTGGTQNNTPDSQYGQANLTFRVPESGEYHIWIRKVSPDDGADSLWLNLQGYGDPAVNPLTIYGTNELHEADGEYWVKWWQEMKFSKDWTWDRVATADLNVATDYTIRLRAREAFFPVDQLLITQVDSSEPTGALSLLPVPQTETLSCSGMASGYYDVFRSSPGAFDFPGDSDSDYAIAPDGTCLKKVEIKDSVASYESGRTYAEELQNFANWFTYYRRRHQAMRGGLASAFQGISGVQAGIYWINNQRTVEMYDLDSTTDQESFLSDIYGHIGGGGTALRTALNHARTEFRRSGEVNGISAPIQYECQKNFTLLFTDGYAADTDFTGIGDAGDGAAGSPYQDSYDNTLADVAFNMYDADLRTDLTAGQVSVPSGCSLDNPPAELDCNANLHINTYSVGLGAVGTLFGQEYNDGLYSKVADAYAAPPTWPDVTQAAGPEQIDDLYHAAVNGRGEMFNAQTPAGLQTELAATVRDIVSAFGSASGVTFNSATLESDSLIFSALFNSTSWSGDVEARALNPANGAISETASWTAASQLEGMLPSQRVILTYDDETVNDGVAFQWANLNSGQRADLNTGPGGNADALGEDRLDYLRGDTSLEGQQFRNRDGLLGDIVNSTPLFVGAPSLNWPDAGDFGTEAKRYSAFRGDEANVNRTPMVYVGSNDGMLHGFKAEESVASGGGDELIAYVPRSVYSSAQGRGLHYLTDPAYQHRYYVDLSPQAVDVFMPATDGGVSDWRTVLIGGLRGGGAGLFALDVTDPSDFSEANASDLVLWEFDDSDLPQMNYQLEQPVVVMMNNGRWALVMGNGFNNDGVGTDAENDETGLIILYMDGGLDGSWDSGDYVYLKVADTGGMGAVNAIDTNGDQVADRIYGGDLEGNLWVFDVSGSNPNNWGSAYSSGNTDVPLFTASVDSDNDDVLDTRQPMAMRPLVLSNTLSEGAAEPDYLVYFGTGKYLETGDLTDQSLQSVYAVWDEGEHSLDRDDLQEQTIQTTGNLRNIDSESIDWAGDVSTQYGWFMDLPESGERVLNTPRFRGEVLFFETYTPNSDVCDIGGTSWFMSVTMDGMDPPFAVFDANGDGVISSDEGIYAGQKIDNSSTGATAILGKSQYFQNIDGQPDQREVDYGDDSNRAGRLGWRELIDF